MSRPGYKEEEVSKVKPNSRVCDATQLTRFRKLIHYYIYRSLDRFTCKMTALHFAIKLFSETIRYLKT